MGRQFDLEPFKKLRRPTEEEWAVVACDLKLSKEQIWELRRCVDGAIDHCKQYCQMRIKAPDPNALKDKAQKISKLLAELEKEIRLGCIAVSNIGLPENLGVIGRLLSFEAVASISGAMEIDCLIRPELDKIEQGSVAQGLTQQPHAEPVGLLQLEWELADRKRMVDVRRRPDLLIHIVRTMQQQFDPWLQQAATDAGGAPVNAVRRIMLHALACDARRILGRPVRKTGGPAFIELCTQVFHACEIDTEGLEHAVRNHLKKSEVWAEVHHRNEIKG